MKLSFSILVTLAVLAPALPAPAILAQEDAPFAVAVVRSDGRVVPFASYTGSRWLSKWPTDIRWIDVPISLSSVSEDWWGRADPPTDMTLWADGASRGKIALGNPEPTPIACDRRITLKSDYRSKEQAPLVLVQPYPKDGLAVSGAQTVERIETVARGSADWQKITSLIFEEFNKAENRAADTFTSWRHPVAPRDRRRIPMEIEAVYQAPMDGDGGTAYFVEALRRYPPRPEDEGCGLVTLVSGFVLLGEQKPKFELEGHVAYCDRRGAIYMLPLGLVRADGRAYWIYQLSGYGHELYRVTRPQPKGVRHEITYTAAWCGNL